MSLYRSLLIAIAAAALALIVGCDSKGPAEKAGEQIDEAVEQAQEDLGKTSEAAGEAVEEVGEKIQESGQ
jgi:hyperosmotically inducible protein